MTVEVRVTVTEGVEEGVAVTVGEKTVVLVAVEQGVWVVEVVGVEVVV